MVLRAVEDDLVCELNEMAHLWHSCAGTPTGWGDDSVTEYHRKEANKAFRDVGRLRLPWYKQWARNEGRELADLYKAFKAREKDPEYAAHLKELRRKVNERVKQAREEAKALDSIREELRQEREAKDRQSRRRRRAGLRRSP